MPKLFMVCLGGKVTGCNIEMHDIRFVIGDSIEQTYQQLKQQWCGDKSNVHIDSYVCVDIVDGYSVSLNRHADLDNPNKLYFVNLGAYYPNFIMEQHSFDLIVAHSEQEAKQIALSRAPDNLDKLHKDRLMQVDGLLPIDLLDGFHIHLTHTGKQKPFVPDWYGYQPI